MRILEKLVVDGWKVQKALQWAIPSIESSSPVSPRAQTFPTSCKRSFDPDAAVRILEKVVVDGWRVEKALQWAASEAGLPDDIKELVELALSTKTKPLTGVCATV